MCLARLKRGMFAFFFIFQCVASSEKYHTPSFNGLGCDFFGVCFFFNVRTLRAFTLKKKTYPEKIIPQTVKSWGMMFFEACRTSKNKVK